MNRSSSNAEHPFTCPVDDIPVVAHAPSKANSAKRGRKPAWHDGYLEQAKKLAALGATDAEMAEFFGVSLKTFTRWKLSKPEFCLALKFAKHAADERVERRLYERAVGYSFESEKVFCFRGNIVRVPIIEHVPPDVTAGIFWLKNRDPERWREKIEVEHRHLFNFVGVVPTREEWLKRYGTHQEPLVIESRQVERPDENEFDK